MSSSASNLSSRSGRGSSREPPVRRVQYAREDWSLMYELLEKEEEDAGVRHPPRDYSAYPNRKAPFRYMFELFDWHHNGGPKPVFPLGSSARSSSAVSKLSASRLEQAAAEFLAKEQKEAKERVESERKRKEEEEVQRQLAANKAVVELFEKSLIAPLAKVSDVAASAGALGSISAKLDQLIAVLSVPGRGAAVGPPAVPVVAGGAGAPVVAGNVNAVAGAVLSAQQHRELVEKKIEELKRDYPPRMWRKLSERCAAEGVQYEGRPYALARLAEKLVA